MTTKSATPSGLPRLLVPVDADVLNECINRQPLPLERAYCLLALDLWLHACRGQIDKMPGRRAFATAWGISERQARTIIEAWSAGRGLK